MTEPVTAVRWNPLRTYQFRLKLLAPGQAASGAGYVAGVRTVSGLSLQVAPFEVWEGGNNLHRYANPNRVSWEPLTLEQGLALDDTLERWARAVVDFSRTGRAPANQPVKRELLIDVWEPTTHPTGPSPTTERPQRLRSYRVFNAWISKYQALPKLDALANEVALLSVEVIHEGWVPLPPPPAE